MDALIIYKSIILEATMTKEEIFNEAQICYDNCKLMIKGLAEVTKAFDPEFDEAKCYVQFDLLLQTLLYSQAIVDEDFCEEEKEFITKLAGNNDFFKLTEEPTLKDLTWDKVYEMPIDEQVKLSEAINNALNDAADEFVLPFAILDAATTQNSLLDLSSELSSLSLLLAAVDGVVEDDELYAFQNYADQLILGKWADVKGLTQILMEDENFEDDENTAAEE